MLYFLWSCFIRENLKKLLDLAGYFQKNFITLNFRLQYTHSSSFLSLYLVDGKICLSFHTLTSLLFLRIFLFYSRRRGLRHRRWYRYPVLLAPYIVSKWNFLVKGNSYAKKNHACSCIYVACWHAASSLVRVHLWLGARARRSQRKHVYHRYLALRRSDTTLPPSY